MSEPCVQQPLDLGDAPPSVHWPAVRTDIYDDAMRARKDAHRQVCHGQEMSRAVFNLGQALGALDRPLSNYEHAAGLDANFAVNVRVQHALEQVALENMRAGFVAQALRDTAAGKGKLADAQAASIYRTTFGAEFGRALWRLSNATLAYWDARKRPDE